LKDESALRRQVGHPQRAISAGAVEAEAERSAPQSLPPVDANPPS